MTQEQIKPLIVSPAIESYAQLGNVESHPGSFFGSLADKALESAVAQLQYGSARQD